MGMERALVSAAVMLLGALSLRGELQTQTGNVMTESGSDAGSGAALEVIDLSLETGIGLDREREAEMHLVDGTYRSRGMDDWGSYSVHCSREMRDYGELTGSYVWIALPLAEFEYIVVWGEESGGFTAYFPPEGGMDVPHEIPDSFWGEGEDAAQGSSMTLRDLNTYLLERLFIELNDQNTEEYKGEYRICDYSVTNRYWTDNVIGTDIVFHVTPKAERAEDLEYFQGLLARVGLTDTERIKELLSDLQVPSPKMEAVIEELQGMLAEKGYTPEEAERIADTLMFRYYAPCAKWLTEEQEYAFCFRTQLDEDGNPVSISIDRSGGGRWNTYVPHLKTKEEQREAYFQAGYDEMDSMMSVMF